MTTPTDDSGKSSIQDSPLYDPEEDKRIREAIKAEMARLGPEEGRKWRERMVKLLAQTVIVERGPRNDGERG